MPTWLEAGLWGLVAGAALLIGAALGYFARIPERAIEAAMAFGAGVLISVLSFDLMDEAYRQGGFAATAGGFLAGAVAYSAANAFLARQGSRQSKRSGNQEAAEQEAGGRGLAIAVGALLDGIPEAIVIGVSLLGGGAVSAAAVAGVFLSNIPEGLSSSAGMKKDGRSPATIFGVWASITLVSGIAALLGYAVFGQFADDVIAATTAVAAGAILAMLAETMIPEAFEEAHDFTGLITGLGFLAAFVITRLE